MLPSESDKTIESLKPKEPFQSFSLLQIIYGKTIMLCCCKGNDMFEEFIVRKSEPLLGNIHVDGSSTIVTAFFIPCFVKLGFIGSSSFLLKQYHDAHSSMPLRSGLRNVGQRRLRRIGGLALLRIPPIDHEFLLVHISYLSS